MRDWLLSILVCPRCGGSLSCEVKTETPAGIDEGVLRCACGGRYPILDGVPRMLAAAAGQAETQDAIVESRTRASFGFEWTTFATMRPEWAQNFAWYMAPKTGEFLRDKLILDAGCGMGRHLYHVAAQGGRVVGIDFSRAVEAARRNTAHLPGAQVVQADIVRPPFRPGTFDFAYCLGVLHHLPQPVAALGELANLVRDGGECRIYVYRALDRSRKWRVFLLQAASLARQVTTRLPHRLLLAACWPIAITIWLAAVGPFKLMRRFAPDRALSQRWLFGQYAPYPFSVLLNDQFDRFSAPIERRYTREAVEALMRAAGLVDIDVTERFGWVAHGSKPARRPVMMAVGASPEREGGEPG